MQECKKKRRLPQEKRALLGRAARIEGQLRGIYKMIEEDAYCIDVLTQLSAAQAAVRSLSCQILIAHLSSCVKEGVARGDEQVITELAQVMKQFMK